MFYLSLCCNYGFQISFTNSINVAQLHACCQAPLELKTEAELTSEDAPIIPENDISSTLALIILLI